ncbi:hypothetical protein CEK28_11500 [Xenophilus sp. AP218F]|nr:EAL domain-containing protein [Chromobacterium sp. ASV5]OWY38712.1 hypothetical protein CEK28_11500 [Xenophilus sp. AP218F]
MSCHILIVEDSPSQREALAALCRVIPGAEVLEASDGRWAQLIAQQQPKLDLVITDINMPGMDGIELVQALSHMVKLPALLFLSGHVPELLDNCALAAEQLGFAHCGSMAKPIDPDRFLEQVSHLLEAHREQRGPEIAIPLTDIITGLAHNQFCAFYQPIFNQHNAQAEQVEALARWHHPQHGLLGPGYFIDRLEHEGAILLLTRRMVQTSLDLLAGNPWARHLRVSINLSRQLLHEREFFDWLLREIELRAISPNQIVLEITETLAFHNLGNTLASLLRMRMRGLELSLDDFGTGHTNMEHLRNLPLTELKLDRSLILGIHRDSRSQSILNGIVQIGRELSLRMVAEGIDNSGDLNYLQTHYPDLALQGFLLCPPIAPGSLAAHLSWQPNNRSASA